METEYKFKGSRYPWRADLRPDEESSIPWGITVPYGGACLPVADICNNPTDKEQIAANAQVIAMAPQLLGCCIEALPQLKRLAMIDSDVALLAYDIEQIVIKSLTPNYPEP